jgi:hypothetical protein
MSIVGGGLILLEVDNRSGGSLWQQTAFTGGKYFDIWSTQTCGPQTVPGFTETEEIYNASLGAPPYAFFFTNSSENGRAETAWAGLTSASLPADIVAVGANVTLYNEPFWLAFVPSVDTTSLEATPYPQVVQCYVLVSVLNATAPPVVLGTYSHPLLWAVSATPRSASGSFVAELNITIPGGVVPGTYLVGIDGVNGSAPPNRITLQVNVLPSLYLTISALPLSGHVDANETVSFLVNATGGALPYDIAWSGLPSGCTNASVMASCRFVHSGSYSLHAGLTDALGYVRYQNTTFVVHPDPVISAKAGTIAGTVGQTLTLGTSLSGGLPPYRTQWVGLPPGCGTVSSNNLTCTPSAGGNYTVTVTSTDSAGFRASLLLIVTIGAPGSGGLLSGSSLLLVVTAVALVAIVIAGAAALSLRRRRRSG